MNPSITRLFPLSALALSLALRAQIPVPPGAQAPTFAAPVTLSLGTSQPHDLEIANMNGDGIPDLVSCNFNDGTLTVALATGTNPLAFTPLPANAFGTLTTPSAVEVADWDGDGDIDAAVRCTGSTGVSPPSFVVILLNDGTGTLIQAIRILAGAVGGAPFGPNSMAAADFDGDGTPDLALATQGGVVVVANTAGTGLVWTPITITPSAAATPFTTLGVAAGPMGLSPVNDLMVVGIDAAGNSQGAIVLFSAPPVTGILLPNLTVPGTFAHAVAITDIDNDAVNDVAILGRSSLDVFINTGGAILVPLPSIAVPVGGGNLDRMVVAMDLEGDGRTDLVQSNDNGSFGIARNFASGLVLAGPITPGSPSAGKLALAAGNLDQDAAGTVDLAVGERFTGNLMALVNLTPLAAWSVNAAAGCAAGGALAMTPPVLGTSPVVSLASAPPNQSCVVFFSGGFATTPLSFVGSCPVFLDGTAQLAFAGATDAAGFATFIGNQIPNIPGIAGIQAGLQAFTFDGSVFQSSNLVASAIGF